MARRESNDSEPPESRRGLESVIPDLIKKAVQGGVDRATGARDTINTFIADSKLPKEIANALFSQIDETKNGLFRVVAKEIRSFLEAVDFQRELQKLLTTVSFEIKTEIRFIPNDSSPDKLGRPAIKNELKVKRKKRRGEEDEPGDETPPPPPVDARPETPRAATIPPPPPRKDASRDERERDERERDERERERDREDANFDPLDDPKP